MPSVTSEDRAGGLKSKEVWNQGPGQSCGGGGSEVTGKVTKQQLRVLCHPSLSAPSWC